MKRFLTVSVVLLLIVCALSAVGAGILRDMQSGSGTSEDPGDSEPMGQPSESSPDSSEESQSESTPPPPPPLLTVPELSCTQAFVYDVTSDAFVYEKGTDRPIVPASITKLLTALCALHYMPADGLITPGDEQDMLQKGSSIAYVKSNHTLTLSMLVEGMMLPSGNDAALAVAAGVARYLNKGPGLSGAEAVSIFMGLVNDYAKAIGCTDTHFTVPDGFAYEGHTTTAHDLAVIGKAALNNEILRKYAATVSEKVTYASGHVMTWKNTNPLIDPESSFYSPYVTGLKTGSLAESFSVMVSAEIGGKIYLIGLFGSPTKDGRYQDAHTILNLLLAQTV
ncbi:MAG: D-alanyl-D-alanine carboxypeptidase [Ruminococcaceae bacterium]|nr:D-alanyl-D-alanine carboxypeptidase [Oscillospiraceae bacterium]